MHPKCNLRFCITGDGVDELIVGAPLFAANYATSSGGPASLGGTLVRLRLVKLQRMQFFYKLINHFVNNNQHIKATNCGSLQSYEEGRVSVQVYDPSIPKFYERISIFGGRKTTRLIP